MRRLPPEIVTPPTVLPVSLDEAKRHLRVDHDLDDVQIGIAIEAATRHLDGYTGILGRAMLTQTWRDFASTWPASRAIPLSLSPVASITSITSRDSDGLVTTLALGTDYRLVSGMSYRPFILLARDAALPSPACEPDAVKIDYIAGYGEASAVPAPLRHAILMMVGDMYRFTESAAHGAMAGVPISATVDRLIAPYRRVHL